MRGRFLSAHIAANSLLAAAGLSLMLECPALAQPRDHSLTENSSQRVRSFKDIAAVVTHTVPGRILRIRHIRYQGRMVYIARVLNPDGKRQDVIVDAATLKVIDKEYHKD